MLPLDAMAVLADRFAEAAAVATLAALTVGTPPARSGGLATVPFGTLQLASVMPQTGGGGGGVALTVNVSLAELPVSTAPINRCPEVFAYVPAAGTATLTRTVHVLLPATVPFEKEIDDAPATGAKVAAAQPDVLAAGGVATTIAPGKVGNVSENESELTGPLFGFVSVKVSVETPPTVVGLGVKRFDIVTSEGSTIVAILAPTAKSLL